MRRIWIIGPISIDTVISIDQFPKNGGFAQSTNRQDRPGGSALNTAVALTTAGVEVNLISFKGDDENGRALSTYISKIEGLNGHIETLPGPSLHALITVDKSGERTVFALEKNRLPEIKFDFKFDGEDIVCFPVWRNKYLDWLKLANSAAGFTVVGATAISNSDVVADLAIGSESEADYEELDFARIKRYISTKGARGSEYIDANERVQIPALEVELIDATGAGDAYLAGILLGLAQNSSIQEAMARATKWAAATVMVDTSIPPSWSEVCLRFGS